MKKRERSSSESSLDSMASRINFWKEIKLGDIDKKRSVTFKSKKKIDDDDEKFQFKNQRKIPTRK